MKNLSLFQVIVMTMSGFLLIIGLVVFALRGGSFSSTSVGSVTIWGTLDGPTVQSVLNTIRQSDKTLSQVNYVEKDPATYETDLINAIAAGTPPDLFLLPQDDIAQFSDKVQTIPYSSISQSAFNSTYIDESQLYLTPSGTIALPLLVDPLVMYWNRDLFATAGIPLPPSHWSEVLADAPRLTVIDQTSSIKRSAAALGFWSNVTNAKEIFSTLVMQAGDPIVSQKNSLATPVFGTNPSGAAEVPAEAALRFYTDFANPSKTVYSWNRSQPLARDAFTAGETAMYFGFASEEQTLTSSNPNLRAAVALIPQVDGSGVSITYGKLMGFAIPRGAANVTGAVTVAGALTGATDATLFANAFHLPPARRDLLQQAPANDPAMLVFMQSALIARGFVDPNPIATDNVFRTMVESVVSGAQTPADAVSAGMQKFAQLFPQQ